MSNPSPREPHLAAVRQVEVDADVPWGIAESVGALGIAILIAVIGGIVLQSVAGSALAARPLPPLERQLYWANGLQAPTYPIIDQLEWDVLAYQVLVLGIVVSALWPLRGQLRLRLSALGYHFPGWKTLLISGTTAVLLVYVGVAVISFLFDTLLPGYHLQGNARELVQGTSGHFPLGEEVLVFLWASIEAPLAEETLFRGIVFQGLRRSFARRLPVPWAVLTGAILSGLVFGLAHLQPRTLPILVFLGIVLAYVFDRTHSVYASALVHGIINGLSVILLFSMA